MNTQYNPQKCSPFESDHTGYDVHCARVLSCHKHTDGTTRHGLMCPAAPIPAKPDGDLSRKTNNTPWEVQGKPCQECGEPTPRIGGFCSRRCEKDNGTAKFLSAHLRQND